MNRIYNFRNHDVKRTCTSHFNDYHEYKDNLSKDFQDRCGYCNIGRYTITTPFEIDHFVPKKVFVDKKESLLTDYSNLVYSCKKCNNAKRSKHAGEVNTNDKFYNPADINMNLHFYVKNGIIREIDNDEKAQRIIIDLRLNSPVRRLVWIVEHISELKKRVNQLPPSAKKCQYLCYLSVKYMYYEEKMKLYYNISAEEELQIKL